jgi:anti-sigma B factor antagonist
MSKKLEVTTYCPDAATCVLHLRGTLHGTEEGYAFQDEVRRRFTEGAKKVVVDLSGVDHIDSSGIGIFATIVASSRNTGARVALAALPPRIEQVMRLVRLLDVVECAPTVDEAIGRLDSKDPL